MARFHCDKFMDYTRYLAGEGEKPAVFGSVLRSALLDSASVFLTRAYAYFLYRATDDTGEEHYAACCKHLPGRLYVCLSLFLSAECPWQPEWLRQLLEKRRASRQK